MNKQPLLDTFYGNEQVKATLVLHCEDGRLPHALLLEGESGCGKKTFARLIAAAAVCTGGHKPCGVCRHCEKAMDGTHPDIIWADGGENTKNLNVESIRRLRASASVRPNEAACKVYVLADAQAMTAQAQNALLKVLEEPPEGVIFVLTCENRSSLLETVLSRVLLLRLESPPAEDCARALQALVPGHTEEEYRLSAELFEGNIGRASASLQDEGFRQLMDRADRVAHAVLCGTEYDLLAALAVFEGDRDGLSACLRRLSLLFSRLLGARYRGTDTNNPLARAVSALQCRRILAIIEEASRLLEQNMGYPLASVWLCSQLKMALAAR